MGATVQRMSSTTVRQVAALSILLAANAASAAEPHITTAVADGRGKVAVNVVYYAEDTCMKLVDVREGPPATIERPRRTLVVTVELARVGSACEQKLRTLDRTIEVDDRPGVKSGEVFFVDKDGKFIRSARPPIDRPEDVEELQ